MKIKVLCSASVGKYLSCNETIECDFGKVILSSNYADHIITCPKCGAKFTVSTCDKCDASGIQYPNSDLKERCIECNGYGFQANEMIQDAPTKQ
jgi:predicted RNA-binding Zn-ribbon protein involved in translation (DUF1610 family)